MPILNTILLFLGLDCIIIIIIIIIHLVQSGLTAGWLAGWLADNILVDFELLIVTIDQNFKLFDVFNKVTVLSEQCEWDLS